MTSDLPLKFHPAATRASAGFAPVDADRTDIATNADVVTYQPSITGTSGPDTLTGDFGSNTIQGLGDDDVIHGALSDDFLEGGEGEDEIYGDSGNDVIQGDDDNDALSGGKGDDFFLATVNDGNDAIDGGLGHDVLDFATAGVSSATTVNLAMGTSVGTQTGSDTVASIEEIWAGSGNDVLSGGSADETFYGNDGDDELAGGEGADTLFGALGSDTIDGGGGLDLIAGGDDDDLITGGAGDDEMYGDDGDDTFVFNAGFGNDVIGDFIAGEASEDVIEFNDNLFADYSALLGAATQSGDHVVIEYNPSNTLTLQYVQLSSLHPDDFHLLA